MIENQMLLKIAVKPGDSDFLSLLDLAGLLSTTTEVLRQPGLLVLSMAGGTLLEIHGQSSPHPSFLFENGPLVVSFKVENAKKIAAKLLSKGVVFPEEVQEVNPPYAYFHIRLKNGLIIGFHQS